MDAEAIDDTFDEDEEDGEHDYDQDDYERDEWECIGPECLHHDPLHMRSECFTEEDAKAYYDEMYAEGKE